MTRARDVSRFITTPPAIYYTDEEALNNLMRYRFVATGGETTISGVDANGSTLSYVAGIEKVYLNGALLVRGYDYIATNGTSITSLSPALVANDVIEVFSFNTFNVANTYTQSQADGLFATKTENSLVKIDSTSYSGVSSKAFDNVFSSTYRAYIVEVRQTTSTNNNCVIRYRASGATDSTSNYYYQRAEFNSTTVTASRSLANDGYGPFAFNSQIHVVDALFVDPNGSDAYKGLHTRVFTGSEMSYMSGRFNTTTSFDGFILIANTGTITGTTTIWGLKA